ncbi:MAG TPA: FAD-binding dehydrogenase [Coriobacteriia bacterium]|nr:FAD-binding dehydrogenase [Coriobacteriia bacterium]
MDIDANNHAISRRSFMSLSALGAGVFAATGLAGCAPRSAEEEASAKAASESGTSPDWLGENVIIEESRITETRTTEVLIIGAGNGGMSAAATAATLGIDFVVCEKGTTVQSTRGWVGGINTKWHKEANIEIDEGKVLNELTRYASGRCDQSVWRTWIRESAATIEFLHEALTPYGLTLYLDTEGYDHATGGTDFFVPPIQHMWYDPNVKAPLCVAGPVSPLQRNNALELFINDKGYTIDYGHKLVQLIREDGGRVQGAVFETEAGYVKIQAEKGILLATGGYAANPAMVQALNFTTPSCVTMGCMMPNCTGDGIKAALHIGATKDEQSAAMIFDRGSVAPGVDCGYIDSGGELAFPVYGEAGDGLIMGSQPFMKVNRLGKRFFNESAPYDWCTFAASKQPGGVWCSVFDAKAPEDVQRFSVVGCAKSGTLKLQMGPIEEVFKDVMEQGVLISANTLEELAEKLGLPVDDFIAEVERYNTFFDAQKDEDFGKEAYRLSALRTPPFYGFWNGGQFLTTLDGLCINSDMQVLDDTHTVIDGLYAAGDCSGSLYAGNYPEYLVGNASGRTLTFARHAVLHMTGNV